MNVKPSKKMVWFYEDFFNSPRQGILELSERLDLVPSLSVLDNNKKPRTNVDQLKRKN